MTALIYLMQWLALAIGASVIQRNWRIPMPVTLLGAVILGNHFNLPLFHADISSSTFDLLVLITLPLLIAVDAMKMEWPDIKNHGFSLFWTAGVSVFLAIGAGVLINHYVLINYPIPLAGVVMLFAMLVATDPITVSAIFSTVEVPHQLKVLTEGESLFNDAAALIAFSLGMMALQEPNAITTGYVAQKIFMVVGGAVIIGLIVGAVLSWAMKLSDEPFVEGGMILLAAYGSYAWAEHFHFSGILAIIVAMLFVSHRMRMFIANSDNALESAENNHNFKLFAYALTTKDNVHMIQNSVNFMALLAASALFISIGVLTDLETLWKYKSEIVMIFLATTLIRAGIMLKFAGMSRLTKKMHTVPMHWWGILTFAGSKGALSILMVHMIPASFEYKALFESIVVGNILLSILVYAPMLALIIKIFKTRFAQESLEDPSHH